MASKVQKDGHEKKTLVLKGPEKMSYDSDAKVVVKVEKEDPEEAKHSADRDDSDNPQGPKKPKRQLTEKELYFIRAKKFSSPRARKDGQPERLQGKAVRFRDIPAQKKFKKRSFQRMSEQECTGLLGTPCGFVINQFQEEQDLMELLPK